MDRVNLIPLKIGDDSLVNEAHHYVRPRRSKFGGQFPLVLIAFLLGAIGVVGYSKFLAAPASRSVNFPVPSMNRSSSGPSIVGQASVIDGDTIEIHGKRIRLFGIDAPESSQTCKTADGKEYPCGQQAAHALDNKIRGHTVECRPNSHDQYGRDVAVCFVSGEDINGWMVTQGWAVAYRYFSTDYVGQEGDAANLKRNIWQGPFENPRDWRRNHSGGTNLQRSKGAQRPKKFIYYRPQDTFGSRYQTLAECEEARRRAGNVGVCVMK